MRKYGSQNWAFFSVLQCFSGYRDAACYNEYCKAKCKCSSLCKLDDEKCIIIIWSLNANQNKNNCLVINFLDKLKSPALFSHLFRTGKSAGNFSEGSCTGVNSGSYVCFDLKWRDLRWLYRKTELFRWYPQTSKWTNFGAG